MDMEILLNIFQDGFFAAIAAIGFASISNPPKSAYLYCALIAAAGHSVRYIFTTLLSTHLIVASTVAAFVIGLLAVWVSPKAKCPAETCLFPALLPMIPGMYAYRTIGALLLCLNHTGEEAFSHYFYLMNYNGFTCVFIIMGMDIGATIPIFIFKNTSFQATR